MILKTTCSGWILLRLDLQFGELPSPSSAPCFCLVRQFSPLRLKIGVVSDFVALSFVAEMTKFGEKVTLDSQPETKLSEVRSDQVVVNEWHKKHVVCRARLNGPWLTWWNELTTKSLASLILPMHFLFSFLLLHFLAHLLLLLKYCFKLSGPLQTFLNSSSPSRIITKNFPLTSLHYRWPWGFIFPSPTFVKNNQIKSKWSISQSLPSLLLFTIVETCNLSFIVYRLCPLHKAAKNNKGKDKYKTCTAATRVLKKNK